MQPRGARRLEGNALLPSSFGFSEKGKRVHTNTALCRARENASHAHMHTSGAAVVFVRSAARALMAREAVFYLARVALSPGRAGAIARP